MHEIYEDQSSGASNIFNSIKRNAFLYDVTITYPPLARYVRNCYYANTQLFIIGRSEIQSMEGTTQGDHTEMAIYAIANIPLILMLVVKAHPIDNTAKAAAYADDLTASGTIMR